MQKLIEGAGNKFSMKANKLLSKIKNDSYNPIYAKLDMEDIGDKLKEVQELEIAIRNKNLIKCQYDFEEYNKELDLKPLKIANYVGFWYLIALDARNDILKKYYLKNIKQIKLLDENFETDAKLDRLLENSISIWFDKEVEPYKVTLQISSEVSKYFIRKPISKSQVTESLHEDGSMVVTVEITEDMEIIPFVKYWTPHIKVLDPTRIEETIKKDLENYLNEI
jgi:predicted DNA-binding transcriptional regulator YafY